IRISRSAALERQIGGHSKMRLNGLRIDKVIEGMKKRGGYSEVEIRTFLYEMVEAGILLISRNEPDGTSQVQSLDQLIENGLVIETDDEGNPKELFIYNK